MKSLLASHAVGKKLTSNILNIASEAQDAKMKDQSIIDATIGMLYNETGTMMKFPTVEHILNNLTDKEKFYYSPTSGGDRFKDAIKKWVLQDKYKEITETMFTDVMATPGGSGAISNTVSNYLNIGDSVLLPSVYWGPYKNIANEFLMKVTTYEMFKGQKLNTDAFVKGMNELALKQKRIVTIINDPCHNPTGYSMSDEEWKIVFDCVNNIASKGIPVILLYDIAYIDYYPGGIKESRNKIELLKSLNENAMCIVAFSGSKTLSMYGYRVGAQLAISNQESHISEFTDSSEHSSRGKWSNTPRPGISVMTNLVENNDYFDSFTVELQEASKILKDRSQLFIKQAIECNLICLPYKGGFFVTIPSNNDDLFEDLKSAKIYVVPLKGAIRVAICSLSLKEVDGLAKKIKEFV